jgi:hypothetical protein
MRTAIVGGVAAVVLAVAACGGDDDKSGASCSDISGNYKVDSKQIAGECSDTGPTGSTISFSRGANGAWDVFLPGAAGACPGSLDAATCRFTANCVGNDANGQTVATFNIDYKFSGATFAGSTTGALKPPAVPAACNITYDEKGSKL